MDSMALHDHYHQPDLTGRILAALRKWGLDPDHLSRDDLELLDEFHIGGRSATRQLAALANLKPEHEVLDLGCGIGGPARLLAAEHGCRVVGLDLVKAYCEAATELTRRTGLNERVSFQQGDMRDMPFADATFDRVWSQHTLMNIPDKAALAHEVFRVLRPGGKAVFFEVCAGNGELAHLPVAWAGTRDQNHLCGPAVLRRDLEGADLHEDFWEDVTEVSLAWFDAMVSGLKQESVKARPGLGLLMGPEAGLKSRNLIRNLREGRVVVVRGVYSRS